MTLHRGLSGYALCDMHVGPAAAMLQMTESTLRLQAQLMHMPGDMFSTRQQACCIHKQAVLQQGSINSMDMSLSNTVLQRSQSRNGLAMP